MPVIIGIVLAVIVGVFARAVGFDRTKSFYPVVLIVTASYYVLFAVLGGTSSDLLLELLVFTLFVALAVISFRTSLWLAVAGLGLHAVFDCFRHAMIEGRGVPAWWPAFCLSFDLAMGLVLAALLLLEKRQIRQRRS